MDRAVPAAPSVPAESRAGPAPASWLRADTRGIRGEGAAWAERFAAGARRRDRQLMAGFTDRGKFARLLRRVSLDEILLNEEWLYGATGLERDAFFYLAACLEGHAGRFPSFPPLIGRTLPAEHMLCMALYHAWAGCDLLLLQGVFKIDPADAPGIVAGVRRTLAAGRMLPTHRAVAADLAAAPAEEALAFAGGAINMDWLRMAIENSAVGHAGGAAARPGRAGVPSCAVLYGCAARSGCPVPGIIIFGGGPAAGRTGGAASLRGGLPDAGAVTDLMAGGGAPLRGRIAANLDGGLRGAAEALPGASVRVPCRGPHGGGPAEDQPGYNSRLAAERAVVESNFAGMRRHRVLAGAFRGTISDLDDTLAMVTGLVNLKRILRGSGTGSRRPVPAEGGPGRGL